jgi:branched-chain amino acid transport system ATP-binding protein
MLDVEGLHAAYGASRVLFGIDLKVAEGEVIALVGRNGMGKTTIVKSVVGILPSQAGSIRMHGRDIANAPSYKIARAGIGLVPEGRRIFPNLSTHENLIAMAANRRQMEHPWTLERVFHLFPGLAERRNSLGCFLSGGEQQMLAIGRALMTNPQLLILDEATEGLAPKVRHTIWECIWKLREMRQSILIIDQNTNALSKIADRMYVIEKGKIVWTDTARQFVDQRPALEKYLGVAK